MRTTKLIYIQILLIILLIPSVCFSKNQLKVGVAKIDITPTENLYMGGYAETCRENPSDGVFGKIYIRTLVFDNTVEKFAIVEADIVGLPKDDYLPLRQLISDETRIPVNNILLGCVHNHAAPSMDQRNKESAWYQSFHTNVIVSVKEAIADLEPVKIGGCIGKSNMAMNRRKKMEENISYLTFDENNSSQSYGVYKTDQPVKLREMEGVYRLGANPKGSIDAEIGVLRIDMLSGQPKAVFVNYACHGTSLGGRNNKISPEWNGHMLEYIEEQLPGVTGIYSPGAAGDINPRFFGGLEGHKDNLENTKLLGHEMGQQVVDLFQEINTELPINTEIRIVHQDIICPLRYGLVAGNFKKTTIMVPTTIIRIDNIVWVTFPGELFHEIGLKIKSSTHIKLPFLVGYCNGSLGYMPTQEAYSEGGYEPWQSCFAPVAEKIFVKGIEQMLISLH